METWENTYNSNGWGPPANFVCKEFSGLPFTEVSKVEKLGKFFDIFAGATSVPGVGKRYGKESTSDSKEDDMGFIIQQGKATVKAKRRPNVGPPRKQPTVQQTYHSL